MHFLRCLAAFIVLCLPPASARAEFVLNAALSQAYEDNVNLRLSVAGGRAPSTSFNGYVTTAVLPDNGSDIRSFAGTDRSDFYSLLSARAGISSVAGVETYLTLQAEVTHYRFNRFQMLNSTGLGIRAVLSKQFSDMNSGTIGLFGRMNSYEEHAFNGGSFGTSLEVRQQVTQKLALAEGLTWEKSGASDWSFGSTINSVLFRGSYRFSQQFSTALIYGYQHWKFNAGTQTGLHSIQLRTLWQMDNHLGLFAAFERQLYETDPDRLSGGDSITSAGVEVTY